MYCIAKANCFIKYLHVLSGNVECRFMYVDKLPALHSSIIIYMHLDIERNGKKNGVKMRSIVGGCVL